MNSAVARLKSAAALQYTVYGVPFLYYVDEVIGRSGSLNMRNDELLVYASFDVLMRCKIEQMKPASFCPRTAW